MIEVSPYDLRQKPVWQVCIFRMGPESARWLPITELLTRERADARMKTLLNEKPNRLLGVRLKKEILNERARGSRREN